MPLSAALAIVVLTAIAAEFVASAVHRWVMHGPGWVLHRSHHRPRRGRPQANDLYAVGFAALDVALFAVSDGPQTPSWWVAAGIALYGVLYAWVHDGLVHRRFPAGRAPVGGWLGRLVRAHRLHHACRQRDGAVSFGFLWAADPETLAARLRVERQRSHRPGAEGSCAERSTSGRLGSGRIRRDTVIGLGLALAILAGWAGLLAATLSAWRWDRFGAWTPLAAVAAVLLQTWLGAGLFIVAHDAMHGSLAPAAPRAGRAIGRVALWLYAGFGFDALRRAHHAHHRSPGTAADPDFAAANPDRFWPWYGAFMRRYFGVRQALVLATATVLAIAMLGVAPADLLVFWALPSILSSLQLFRWGTFLPHRHGGRPFADAHRAHSDPRGTLVTLATCFHFGLHHAHHLRPDTPWWRLPARARRLSHTTIAAAARDTTGAPPCATHHDATRHEATRHDDAPPDATRR